jgi:hypothetical protein
VRWKMGGILPFPPEEARVSYQRLSKGDQSVELLAMALRNSIRPGAGPACHGGPSSLVTRRKPRKPGPCACLFGFGDHGGDGRRRH